jgi:hypothetical protein
MYRKFALLVLAAAQFGCGGGGGDGGAVNPPAATAPAATAAPTIPVLAASATLIGTSPGVAPAWPDRSTDTGGKGATVAGVTCLQNESYHLHAHLTIIKDGVTQRIPQEIGLTGCAYELHTHDNSGMIHVETAVAKKFTLGQFFAVWGEPLTRMNVAGLGGQGERFFTNDGDTKLVEVMDDPNAIELISHRSIYIVIGTVPATLPKNGWPAGF